VLGTTRNSWATPCSLARRPRLSGAASTQVRGRQRGRRHHRGRGAGDAEWRPPGPTVHGVIRAELNRSGEHPAFFRYSSTVISSPPACFSSPSGAYQVKPAGDTFLAEFLRRMGQLN